MNSTNVPYPSSKYSWYVVAVLTLAYISSFIDRQILALLVEPIKADFQISDTQVSLLMGLSFAVFYTIMGFPFGRMADSKSRRNIIIVGITLWSIMTAFCGIARNFWQFFMARVGVGVGEASLSPSAYSMISDYFPAEKRATAISIYSMGVYIGSGLAYLLGGLIIGFVSSQGKIEIPFFGEIATWQLVFFYVGLPGLLIALIVLTIKEPIRRNLNGGIRKEQKKVVPLKEVFAYFKKHWKTYTLINVGIGFWTMVSYGGGAWIPSFLIRTHAYTIQEAAYTFGLLSIVFASLGVVFGGWLADKWLKRGIKAAKIKIIAITMLLIIPTGLLYPLFDNKNIMLVFLTFYVFLNTAPIGVAASAIQEITPNEMRGQASALFLFVLNILGLAMGPTIIALLTDYVFKDEALIRYSIFSMSIVACSIAAICFIVCIKNYTKTFDTITSEA